MMRLVGQRGATRRDKERKREERREKRRAEKKVIHERGEVERIWEEKRFNQRRRKEGLIGDGRSRVERTRREDFFELLALFHVSSLMRTRTCQDGSFTHA